MDAPRCCRCKGPAGNYCFAGVRGEGKDAETLYICPACEPKILMAWVIENRPVNPGKPSPAS